MPEICRLYIGTSTLIRLYPSYMDIVLQRDPVNAGKKLMTRGPIATTSPMSEEVDEGGGSMWMKTLRVLAQYHCSEQVLVRDNEDPTWGVV